jgi:magnesium chelatase family protein
MLAKVLTSTIVGLKAVPVEAQIAVRSGKSLFTLVGMADCAVRESRERILSALRHLSIAVDKQVLVNLAPAEVRKEGSSFDVPVAVGLLAALKLIPRDSLTSRSFHGELALDGELHRIRGAASMAITAMEQGATEIILPHENVSEVRLLRGIEPVGARSIAEVLLYLRDGVRPPQPDSNRSSENSGVSSISLDEVIGQERAKRALTIAAAGGHNILFIGPPGCGKSMLAQRFEELLPTVTERDLLDIVKVHSVAGFPVEDFLRGRRPFRAPHHSLSDAALVGGGVPVRPGEISLAHGGVLFLDEFPEFRRTAIESLRTPLEEGRVLVSRARSSAEFPARFQLIAAMNPCPCGRLGISKDSCSCSQIALQSYLRKLSQPILDRIDLHLYLQAVPIQSILQRETTPTPVTVSAKSLQAKITEAVAIQLERSGALNGHLPTPDFLADNDLSRPARDLIERAALKLQISARGVMRIMRVARTVADLSGDSTVTEHHVAEALGFRELDRMMVFGGLYS